MATNTYSLDLELSSSQYAYRTDTASLSITGDWTIECWANVETAPGGYYLVSKSDYGANKRSYAVTYSDVSGDKKVQTFISADGGSTNRDRVSWVYNLGTGTWVHVAVTCDVSAAVASEFELFINGSSQGNGDVDQDGSVSSIHDNDSNFAVGTTFNSGSPDTYYDGKLDDVRVWNDIRTGAEIAANYNKELSGSEAGLVGYWKLNNDYTDSQISGNNDLTAGNSPTFSTDVPFTGIVAGGNPMFYSGGGVTVG
jgi:hypothetical protein